jgi:hypothetical protein
VSRYVFHYRKPFAKSLALLRAIQEGALRHGDIVQGEEGFERVRDVDGLVLFGIGGYSRDIFDAYQKAGKDVVFWDKGYLRGGGWYRVAVNCFQPSPFFLSNLRSPPTRFDALGVDLRAYKKTGDTILFDGASNKYLLWHGFGDLTEWGSKVVEQIARHTDLPIIYRPRPTHEIAHIKPVDGAQLSQAPLDEDLSRARVVVSYGGNIGWDCAVAGVPHFAMGDSVARAISETDWTKLDQPRIPTVAARRQWFYDVAYCQYRLEEIAIGQAWQHVRAALRGAS